MKIEIDFDVPKGWKFVKYDCPKAGEYYSTDNGEVHQASSDHFLIKKLILEKLPQLKKYTFIETEEFRPVQQGEWYRNSENNEFRIWESTHKSLGCFLIYKVVIEDV